MLDTRESGTLFRYISDTPEYPDVIFTALDEMSTYDLVDTFSRFAVACTHHPKNVAQAMVTIGNEILLEFKEEE